MKDLHKSLAFPTILQSFGIAAAVIAMNVLFSPIYLFLSKHIHADSAELICFTFIMGIPLIFFLAISRSRNNRMTFSLNFDYRFIPILIVGILALDYGIILPINSLIPVPHFYQELITEMGSMSSIYAFIYLVITAPILEEVLFRGIILEGLLKNYSPSKSILISSILFGVVHLNPWQFISAFSLGIFIGWVYYYMRNVTLAIFMHMVGNLFAYIFIQYVGAEIMGPIQLYGGLQNAIIIIFFLFFTFLLSIFYLNRIFKKNTVVKDQ